MAAANIKAEPLPLSLALTSAPFPNNSLITSVFLANAAYINGVALMFPGGPRRGGINGPPPVLGLSLALFADIGGGPPIFFLSFGSAPLSKSNCATRMSPLRAAAPRTFPTVRSAPLSSNSLITSTDPSRPAATDKAVCPCLLLALTSAPFASSNLTFSAWPIASMSAVTSELLFAFGSAPFSSRSFTQSAPAYIAAYINAVRPSSSLALASAPPDCNDSNAIAVCASASRIAASSFSFDPLSCIAASAHSEKAAPLPKKIAKRVEKMAFRFCFIVDSWIVLTGASFPRPQSFRRCWPSLIQRISALPHAQRLARAELRFDVHWLGRLNAP